MTSRSLRSALVAAAIYVTALGGCSRDHGLTQPEAPRVARVVVSPPADTLTALGETRPLQAVAQDASGNAIPGKVFAWASAQPAVATVNSTSGIAQAVANGRATITATVDGISGQAVLTVEQAVASVVVTPPAASLSALTGTQQFMAVAKDANDHPVTNVTFLWLSSNHNVCTIDATGLATAVGSGSVTITAAARGIPGTATLSVLQTAMQLAFTVQPADARAGEALSPAVQVEIRDASGALVETSRGAVTLALETRPSGATLAGTRTVNAVGGVATFSGLWVDKAGTGHALLASAAGLTGARSSAFSIAPATATKVAFTTPPTDGTAGVVLVPAVQVTIQDAFGNTVTDAIAGVTVALPTTPGGVTLLGTTTAAAVAGVATFADLALERAASAYTLVATAGSLNEATSVSFAIGPAAGTKLAFVVQPTTTAGTQAITPKVQVAVQDAFGNTVTSATDAVVIALVANPSGGTLSGTLTAPASQGIATFNGLRIDRPGTYTLGMSAAGLAGAASNPFAVTLTFVAISAGAQYTCGVTAAGATYCWGDNQVGELGDGTVITQPSPVLVAGGVTFASVSAGSGLGHTCAVTAGGAAYCWGENAVGQLGDGTANNRSRPTPVGSFPFSLAFAAVSAGYGHTCGFTPAGVGYCWGSNASGQVGDGTTTTRYLPALVVGPPPPFPLPPPLPFDVVSAGFTHSCGKRAGGDALFCWGDNFSGQLGDGTNVDRWAPVPVAGALAFASVTAGAGHTCGLMARFGAFAGGEATCWGNNVFGQLGDGTTSEKWGPVRVLGGLTFVGLSAGGGHTCGVTVWGAAYCWGDNRYGQLGDGTTTNRTSPVLVAGSINFAAVSASDTHTCGVTPTGEVYCWGQNVAGQLGNGTFAATFVPVRVVQ